MSVSFDVAAVGNAIVDVIAPADEAFLETEGLLRGAMGLIDEGRAHALYAAMGPGVEASGGSAANTTAGVASLGGTAAFIGKVAQDGLGEVFTHDIRAGGVAFRTPPLIGGAATARCLVNVTPDGQRTMSTFLGASVALTPQDMDHELIAGAAITYLEGYLFDAPEARAAFSKAASIAKAAGRRLAVTLSDGFVVERHRAGLLAFLESEVDIVFANETEALALFETSSLADACGRLGAMVDVAAVTRGALGSVIIGNGEHIEAPAVAVARVVDTTGAGDQYAAGVLYGLARGLPLADCARLGHVAAGEVVAHYGPRPQASLKDLAFAA
jgi:sugar/nucleoside kinase (ribokinase family)